MRSLLLASALLCQTLHAQVSQPQAELLPGAGGTWNVQWWGIEGRSYFLQASDDLENWQYAPVIEAGNNELIEYETGSLGSRHFLRLAYTNQTASDLDTADFDDDTLGNLAEINVHHTDPLKKDSDVDGMPDGWEITHGLDPNDNGSINVVNGPNGDGDGDGIPNLQEFQGGTDPVSPGSFPMSLIFVETTADQYFPAPGPGTLSKSASWLPNDSSSDSIGGFLSPQDMVGAVEGAYPFPPLPPQKALISPAGGTVGVVGATYSSVDSGGARTVHGYTQQGRFWLKAALADIAKGRGSQKYLKVIDRYVGSYSGQAQQLDPLVSIEKLEATAGTGGYSEPLDLKPEVATQSGDFASTTIIRLIPVNIEPIEGMAGVVGDMVPSNRTENPELHFVTPKKTDEIPEDYVTFTATGITEQQITNGDPHQIVEWDGGQAVLNEPLKRRVKRDVATKSVLRIKTLANLGGSEVAKLNVWTVWSSVAITPWEQIVFYPTENDNASIYRGSLLGRKMWRFKFGIHPPELVTDADRPDFSGSKTTPVPGAGKSYFAEKTLPADSAIKKWDVSRQVEITILNPGLIPKLKFPDRFVYKNQPKVTDVPVERPQHPAEGNDDPIGANIIDENNDPYVAVVAEGSATGLEHGIGEISSIDGPVFMFENSIGEEGKTLAQIANFCESARLEIVSETPTEGGTTWFRISDYAFWHHVMAATFGTPPEASTARWVDAGSQSGTGTFEAPEN